MHEGHPVGEDLCVGDRPLRALITIAMNALVFVAILLTIRVVCRYFGALGATDWGTIAIRAGGLFVLPLGIEDLRSSYGGVLDANAAITIAIVMLAEWVLSIVRDRV